MNAQDNLRHTLSLYADEPDARRVLTATSHSHPSPGQPSWTGITFGDLRALLAQLDAMDTP